MNEGKDGAMGGVLAPVFIDARVLPPEPSIQEIGIGDGEI
jgi:hypothetical protein